QLLFETHQGRRSVVILRVRAGPAARAGRWSVCCFLPESATAELAMAEARRDWKTWLTVAALSLGACGVVCAQIAPANPAPLQGIQIQTPASGSLAGRLTDL